MPPWASPKAAVRRAAAEVASFDAWVMSSRPAVTAGSAKAEKSLKVFCMAVAVSPIWPKDSSAASMPALALESVSLAEAALSLAAFDASPKSASTRRTSPVAATASDIFCAAFDCISLVFSRPSFTFSSMVLTTTSLTVATKVELMVSSSVVAPVSVILGATGPDFSFT